MELEGINIPLDIQQVAEECQENGHSLVYVAINDQLAGAIELHATIRPEAREVINELRRRKMEMVIISGDHEQPTRQLAQELGIETYFAETLPENTALRVPLGESEPHRQTTRGREIGLFCWRWHQ